MYIVYDKFCIQLKYKLKIRNSTRMKQSSNIYAMQKLFSSYISFIGKFLYEIVSVSL